MSATIYYWNGLIINSEISTKYKSSIEKLTSGQFQSADLDLKKMRGYRIYSIRANNADRLLFTTVRVGDKPYLLFIEEIEGHAYNKSRFLNNPVTLARFLERECSDLIDLINKEDAFEPMDVDTNELAELDYSALGDLTPVPMDYYKQQLIVLNQAQQEALVVRAPAVIMGPPGSGKSCIASLLIANAESALEKIVYITSNRRLVKDIEASWLAMPNSSESPLGRVRFMTYLDLIYENDPEAQTKKVVGLDEFCSWFKGYVQAQERLLKTKNKNPKRSKQARIQEEKNPIPEKLLDAKLIYQELRIASGYEAEGYIKGQFKSNYKEDSQRQWIFTAYQSYCHYLADTNFLDPSFYVLRFSNQPDRLIIDEGQDFSNRQLKQLIDWQFMIYICMDSHQSLFDCQTSSPFIQQYIYHTRDIKTQYVMLPYSYRVFPAAQPLIAEMLDIRLKLIGGQADKHEFVQLPITLENNPTPGSVHWFEDLPDTVLKTLRTAATSQHFAVVTTEERVDYAKEYFNTQLVFTVAEIKGLEYAVVVLFEIFDDAMFIKANHLLRNPEKANLASSSTSHRAADGVGDPTLGPICNQAFTAMTRASLQLIVCNKRRHNIGLLFDRLKAKVPASDHFEIELNCTPASETEWMEEVRRQIDWNNHDIARQIFIRRLNRTEKEFQLLLKPEPLSVSLPASSSLQSSVLPALTSSGLFHQKKTPVKKTKPARPMQQVITKQSVAPVQIKAKSKPLAVVAQDKTPAMRIDRMSMLYHLILKMELSFSKFESLIIHQFSNINSMSLAMLCQQNAKDAQSRYKGHTSLLSLLCTAYDEIKHKMLGVLLRDPQLLTALCDKLKALLDNNHDLLSDELFIDLGDIAQLYSTNSGMLILEKISSVGGFCQQSFYISLLFFVHPHRIELSALDDFNFEENSNDSKEQVLLMRDFVSKIVRGSRQQQAETIVEFQSRMDKLSLLHFSRVLFRRSIPGLLMILKSDAKTTIELFRLLKKSFHWLNGNEARLFDRLFEFINENPYFGVAKHQRFLESLLNDETLDPMSEQAGFFSVLNHQFQNDCQLIEKLNDLPMHFWLSQIKQHIPGMNISRQSNLVIQLELHNTRADLLIKSFTSIDNENRHLAEILLGVLKRFRLQIPRRERELHYFLNEITNNIINLLNRGYKELFNYINLTLARDEIVWESALAGLLRDVRDQLSNRLFGDALIQSKVKEENKLVGIGIQPKKPMDAIRTAGDVLSYLSSQEEYPPDFIFHCLTYQVTSEGYNILMYAVRYYPEFIKSLLGRLALLSDKQKEKILCMTTSDGYNLFLVTAKFYFHQLEVIFDLLKQLKPNQVVKVLSQVAHDGTSVLTRLGILNPSQSNWMLDLFETLSNQELLSIFKLHFITKPHANGLMDLMGFQDDILKRVVAIVARFDYYDQVDFLCYKNKTGNSLLSVACQVQPSLVEPIIKQLKGMDGEEYLFDLLTARAKSEYNPLFIAIICQPDVIGYLLEVIDGLTHDSDKRQILLNNDESENALLMIAQMASEHLRPVLNLINRLEDMERFTCLNHFLLLANEKRVSLDELLPQELIDSTFESTYFHDLLEENRGYLLVEESTMQDLSTTVSWDLNDELSIVLREETIVTTIHSLLQKDIQRPCQVEAFLNKQPALLSWITLNKLLNKNDIEVSDTLIVQSSLLSWLCAPYDEAAHSLLERMLKNKSSQLALANSMAMSIRGNPPLLDNGQSLDLYDFSCLNTTPTGMRILFELDQIYKGRTVSFISAVNNYYSPEERPSCLNLDDRTIPLDKVRAIQSFAKELHLHPVERWNELYAKAQETLPRSALNRMTKHFYLQDQLAKIIYKRAESPFDLASIVNSLKQSSIVLTDFDLILCDKLCAASPDGIDLGQLSLMTRQTFISKLYQMPALDVSSITAAILRYEVLLMEKEKFFFQLTNTLDSNIINQRATQKKSEDDVEKIRMIFLTEKIDSANQFGQAFYSYYSKASIHCNLNANKKPAFATAMILMAYYYKNIQSNKITHYHGPRPNDTIIIHLFNHYHYSTQECLDYMKQVLQDPELEPFSFLAGLLRIIREELGNIISNEKYRVQTKPLNSSSSFFPTRNKIQLSLRTARDVITNISSLRQLTAKQLESKLALTDEKGRNVLLICAFERRIDDLNQLLNLSKRIADSQRYNLLSQLDVNGVNLLTYSLSIGLPMVARLVGLFKEFGMVRWRAALIKTCHFIEDFVHATPETVRFLFNEIKQLRSEDREEIFSSSRITQDKVLNIFFCAQAEFATDLLSIIMTLSDELRTAVIAPFPEPLVQYPKRLLVIAVICYPATVNLLINAIKQLDRPDILERQLTYLDYDGNILTQALHYRSSAVPELIEAISQLKEESILDILTAIYTNGASNTLIKAVLYAPDYVPNLIELAAQLSDPSREQLIQQTRQLLDGRIGTATIEAQVLEMLDAIEAKAAPELVRMV